MNALISRPAPRRAALAVSALVAAAGLAGPLGTPVTKMVDAAAAAPIPVPVPASGTYLGAFYAPSGQASPQSEIAAISASLDPQLGRSPSIVSLYEGWTQFIPNNVLDQVAYGEHAIPMLSWSCGGVPDSEVVAGLFDPQIAGYAQQLKTFGLPVLLRWFWEMNLVSNKRNDQCLGATLSAQSQATEYQLAFQHIWSIFHRVGATNVAFVWAVSTSRSGENPAEWYYPGDQYVDWVGADGYDRPSDYTSANAGTAAFGYQFGAWYQAFSTYGKPMMIAETGAPVSYFAKPPQPPPGEQPNFIQGAQSGIDTVYPEIKAFVYYAGITSLADWRLDAAGMGALANMGRDPNFAARADLPAPPATCPPPTAQAVRMGGEPSTIAATTDGICPGYAISTYEGSIVAFGSAPHFTGLGGVRLDRPIVGMATTPDDGGYWLVGADGGIFTFGDAQFFGSTGSLRLDQPVVGMAATPDGGGYWLVAADGGIFTFGDAQFFGSTGGIKLNRPVVAMAPSPDGAGYWMVASDGGVFSFGDAAFHGSTGGVRLVQPMVGMSADPAGRGYALVAADGGVFDFGEPFYGSLGGQALPAPIVSLAPSADGNGYLLLGANGAVYPFGDAQYLGRVARVG